MNRFFFLFIFLAFQCLWAENQVSERQPQNQQYLEEGFRRIFEEVKAKEVKEKFPFLGGHDQHSSVLRYKWITSRNDTSITVLDLLPPKTFRIASQMEHPWLIDLIDDISSAVFKTPTGKKMCKQYTDGNPYLIALTLGVTTPTAEKIKANCGHGLLSSVFGRTRHQIQFPIKYPTKYEFVLTEGETSFFKGWTDSDSSFIAVNVDNPSYEHFLKSIIHEIHQTVDVKSFFLVRGEFDKKYQDNNYCVTYAALANPYVRLALSSMRSEKIENQVLKEGRYFETTVPTVGTCTERVKNLLPYMQFYSPLVLAESLKLYNAKRARCPIRFTDLTEDQTLQVLANEEVVLENGKRQNLCDFLETPEFGFFSEQERLMVKGPRPNVGDGSGLNPLMQKSQLWKVRPYSDFSKDFQMPMNENERVQKDEFLKKYFGTPDRKLDATCLQEKGSCIEPPGKMKYPESPN